MSESAVSLSDLIKGMRLEYANGNNVMQYAKNRINSDLNELEVIQIAYDLQAGSYIDFAKSDLDRSARWCKQAADILAPMVDNSTTLLEVGCGEATTLQGVLNHLKTSPERSLGFDVSWSRCSYANGWLARNRVVADIFAANLFEIPLEDSSIDIVYTSHSLEPNGGNELAALKELIRIAKRAVVLIEPIYELGEVSEQQRMTEHGYVKGLKRYAESLEVSVIEHRLLDFRMNPLNPSGLMILEKVPAKDEAIRDSFWRCPLTNTSLKRLHDCFYSEETGIAYPILGGVPVLIKERAIVASAYTRNSE